MNKSPAAHRATSIETGKLALYAVLGSELIFFGTLLSAYFYLRMGQPAWQLSGAPINRLLLPGINTLVLLASALTHSWALSAVQKGGLKRARLWMVFTLALGLAFVAGQIFEFTGSGMQINDQAFGGVFFSLMGFHALHVIAGVALLLLVFWRTSLGDFSARRYLPVEISAWFWYFVVGVWVVMFAALYLV